MSSQYNPHDDLQPATSFLKQIHTDQGIETMVEVRSDFEVVTQRWGELRITEHGIRMLFEYGSPVQSI